MVTGGTEEAEVLPGRFLPMLPCIWDRHGSRPDDLTGATIVRFGTIPGDDVEGGGLVIDYMPIGSGEAKRIVFGFNDEGMWVESKE